MSAFFGCFFIMFIGIVIVFGSQSNWNWFWNERRLRELVRRYGKNIARIYTSCLGVFFIFASIIGFTQILNGQIGEEWKLQKKSEIRDNSRESNQRNKFKQRMEYLINENNKLKNQNDKFKQDMEYLINENNKLKNQNDI